MVRWCNPTAESILGLKSADVLNKPVECAGSRIASVLRETLESMDQLPAQQWTDAQDASLAFRSNEASHSPRRNR